MKFLKTGLVASLAVLSMTASAAQWSQTSLSFLRGSDFESSTDRQANELSFEHASGFAYGDNFFFFDVTDGTTKDRDDYGIYGEWAPRISLGKIAGFYKKDRFVKDVLLAGQMEFGSAPARARLYGVAVDLNIPYFAFFNYGLYVRDNIDKGGMTYQSTITYLLPYKFNDRLQFSWGAYIDIVHGEEGSDSATFPADVAEAHWQTAQQVLMDVGALWGAPGVIQAGMEYQYWNRKFGGKTAQVENNAKWMVKWIF